MESKFIGKMSTFGGPEDKGVGPSEGLALITESNLHLVEEFFYKEQPAGTTGLARRLNPDTFYIACRWNYDETPKNFLIKTMVSVRNPANGRTELAKPVDWGPNQSTGRVADLSPGLARALSLETDEIVEVTVTSSAVVTDEEHGTAEPVKKPRIKKFIETPHHSSRDGVKITRVILHYTAGSTAQGAIDTFLDQDTDNPTSAHYIIDRNGDIYQMVRDSDKAWHCKGANADSIGIEHVAVKNQGLSSEQEKASVALIKWLLSEYKLSPANITAHRFAKGYTGGIHGTDCPHSLFGDRTAAALQDWIKRNFS